MFRLAALLALLLAGCGTTLTAALPRKTTVVTGSLGGPAVLFGGAPLPVPLSTVGVAHAPSDAVSVRGALHPTAAAFGVAGLDLGVIVHPLQAQRAALSLGCDAYGFDNGRDAVLLADPWIASRATLLPWLALSGGAHLPIRLATASKTLRELSPFAPTLFVQPAFLVGRWELAVELRWYAFASCGSCVAPEWVSPGGAGALGVVLGANYRIAGAP
ncbi:MAG TPA: hypothetical protein VF331_21795 [Polyangiales bacterium]